MPADRALLAAHRCGYLVHAHALGQPHRHLALHLRQVEGPCDHGRVYIGPGRRVPDQHQRRRRRHRKVRPLRAHRVHMQDQRWQRARASHHHRTVGALHSEGRQGAAQELLEVVIVPGRAGGQQAVPVEQVVAGPQQVARPVVRFHDPPAAVELDDARPGGVEHLHQRRAKRAGAGQGLPDMPQEMPDPVQLCGRPTLPVDWVFHLPHDARAVGALQAHVERVPGMGQCPQQMVCLGRFPFLLGVDVGDTDQLAEGETPQAGDRCIHGMVGLEVGALPVPASLSAKAGPQEVEPGVAFRLATAARQGAAVRVEKPVDHPGGSRPAIGVERGFVQRGDDRLERVPLAHLRSVPRRYSLLHALNTHPVAGVASGCRKHDAGYELRAE